MPTFPRYTSFPKDADRPVLGRQNAIKEHRFPVRLPDGTEGECRYERLGPAYHRFCYTYHDGTALPRQYHLKRLDGGLAALEQAGGEQADSAFTQAMERERTDWFRRATLPASGSRKPDPAKFRMRAGRAKALAGRYALCLPFASGKRFVRLSTPVETFAEAAALWRERTHPEAVVACCNRLDRCWELLRFNPLVAEGHPRKEGA